MSHSGPVSTEERNSMSHSHYNGTPTAMHDSHFQHSHTVPPPESRPGRISFGVPHTQSWDRRTFKEKKNVYTKEQMRPISIFIARGKRESMHGGNGGGLVDRGECQERGMHERKKEEEGEEEDEGYESSECDTVPSPSRTSTTPDIAAQHTQNRVPSLNRQSVSNSCPRKPPLNISHGVCGQETERGVRVCDSNRASSSLMRTSTSTSASFFTATSLPLPLSLPPSLPLPPSVPPLSLNHPNSSQFMSESDSYSDSDGGSSDGFDMPPSVSLVGNTSLRPKTFNSDKRRSLKGKYSPPIKVLPNSSN